MRYKTHHFTAYLHLPNTGTALHSVRLGTYLTDEHGSQRQTLLFTIRSPSRSHSPSMPPLAAESQLRISSLLDLTFEFPSTHVHPSLNREHQIPALPLHDFFEMVSDSIQPRGRRQSPYWDTEVHPPFHICHKDPIQPGESLATSLGWLTTPSLYRKKILKSC